MKRPADRAEGAAAAVLRGDGLEGGGAERGDELRGAGGG